MRSEDAQKIYQKRKEQKENLDKYHHPKEKIEQLNRLLGDKSFNKNYKILELFCGHGNLTTEYTKYGIVSSFDKICGDGDSYSLFHGLINKKLEYDLIDLDPYGYPCRFFPDIFLLIHNGILIVTFCKNSKPNAWTQQLLKSYFGSKKPSKDQIIKTICNEGLKHWRVVKLIECIDLEKVFRFAFSVERVHAAKFCGTSNLGRRN